jgi:glycosyltransferase involved in cell wall biosynthesis
MRIAWFSPLPPDRSGIAAYSAELLSRLDGRHHIDRYPQARAHDFVWRARRQAYDLVVYQLGNSPAHDYMWAYLPRYPGLVVLHDARLHHARARQLLAAERFDDYRAEFAFNHPGVRRHAAEYAVEGLAGSIYYFWPMLRSTIATARAVAVHNRWVAEELATEFPDASISTIRMGVPALPASTDARTRVRGLFGVPDAAIVFALFGRVTPEKRIGPAMKALAALARERADVQLLIVGEAGTYPIAAEAARLGAADRVKMAGFVDDHAIADYLAAADACLCLRWPTAEETSAAWLRCLAARRPTVVTNLAHLADVPDEVALRVDLMHEDDSLLDAMRRLSAESQLRDALAAAGHDHWRAHHTLDAMADDYLRLLEFAANRPVPSPKDLPPHLTRDHSESTRAILTHLGTPVDFLGPNRSF